MRIQTILNRVEKFKSFVYGEARLEEGDDGPALVVQVGRGRTVGRSARVVAGGVDRTTALRNGGSSSCPCGAFWSSWLTGCDGLIASDVGSPWRWCLGVMARTN